MVERRQRRWSFWAEKGAVAMAILAALSLAVTVRFAQDALDKAADVVIRGDGYTLVSSVVADLWDAQWPVTSKTLTPLLAKHDPQRLRYVALVDRDALEVFAEAGSATITKPLGLPGEVLRAGPRVRVVNALARLYARTDGRRDFAQLTRPLAEKRTSEAAALMPSSTSDSANPAASAAGALLQPIGQRPYLVIEFEPPVIERLQKVLTRIAVVAGAAALVVIALALAWSRATARLSAIQQRAERERRLVALGQASSVIAHELRNPLAALKGHAQLLVEDLVEPSRAKAERVVAGAERLERLTNMLLDFVRDGPLELRTATPEEVVARALVEVPKDRVVMDLTRAPKLLQLDAERTALALHNLLQNAVQATGCDPAPVEVRVTTLAHDVIFEVRDHGAGLTRGSEAQIFDPFVTTKTRGTGLGLSIARRIAEQHQGTLTGNTHSQGGAVFRLVLPLDSSRTRHA